MASNSFDTSINESINDVKFLNCRLINLSKFVCIKSIFIVMVLSIEVLDTAARS